MRKTINVLGTKYKIIERTTQQDEFLTKYDGYCDNTSHKIVICKKDKDCELENFEEFKKRVLRHEIIHAFFFESGLASNFENDKFGISETIVDWFAFQSPKIFEVYKELDIL